VKDSLPDLRRKELIGRIKQGLKEEGHYPFDFNA